MSKNEKKNLQGFWIAVGTSARRIANGQTITVNGSAGTIELE